MHLFVIFSLFIAIYYLDLYRDLYVICPAIEQYLIKLDSRANYKFLGNSNDVVWNLYIFFLHRYITFKMVSEEIIYMHGKVLNVS